jgi:hypothetical protein
MDFDERALRAMAEVLSEVVGEAAEEGLARSERLPPPEGEDVDALVRGVARYAASEFGAVLALVPTTPWGGARRSH